MYKATDSRYKKMKYNRCGSSGLKLPGVSLGLWHNFGKIVKEFDRTIEQNGLKETSAKLGKGIIAFRPLAQGLLTNRYLNGIPEERLNQIRGLNEIALERGQSLAEMALSWVLKDGMVTSVLIGASKSTQILDNIKALDNTHFTVDELCEIDKFSL